MKINMEMMLDIIKDFYMIVMVYFLNFKILNKKLEINFEFIKKLNFLCITILVFNIAQQRLDYQVCMMYLILSISIIFENNNIKQSILVTIISLSIDYIVWWISVSIDFTISKIFNIDNNVFNLFFIMIAHLIIISRILKIKKFKYGIMSLKNSEQNEYVDIFILIISIIIIFAYMIIIESDIKLAKNIAVGFIIFSIIMFITIQKSLQLYYKQKMLIKDLIETKEELENKKKEIEELEAENIRISKKNHTIVHKQKSIEHKLEEMLIKSEISIEEAGEVKERLEKLHTQIYSEKENTELDKTGISDIDDMLNYMQSECTKNKIEFTLVIKENIHYMVNNLISKEDLETLIADHIKDAIIAINHTDNINRGILVKLGNIDGIYSLYIYDSGIEFKKEVLENLGNKPFTTYESEGGTGMGFMNTFDTLRKYNASLSIEEFNEPIIDNYTKVIAIKFDKKKEVKIKSYQGIDINKFI